MTSPDAHAVARELQLESSRRLGSTEFHGHSMRPFLEDGDDLVVEPVEWERIAPGDVIVFRFEDKYPALRVVEKHADKVFLRSDAWRGHLYDAWREDVLGRVVARKRGGDGLTREDAAWKRAARIAVARYRLGRVRLRVRSRARRAGQRAARIWTGLRHGLLGLPAGIQVNVSSVCNLECRMCPYLGVHQDDSRLTFLTRETFEKLLPAMAQVGNVHLSGSGEPLYNKDLVHFVERIRAVRPGARISVTTNGTLLRDEIAAELVRLRVDELHVSIDGANPETVAAIRRGVDVDRVLTNVRRLTERKREAASPFPMVMANFMVGYGTYDELVDFVRLAKRVGITEIQLLEMQPARAEDARESLQAGLVRDGGRSLKEAIQLAERTGIAIHLPSVSQNACFHPYQPHVGEDGEVYPCCFLDYDGRQLYSRGSEVRLPALSFGNVATEGFARVWNSRAYRAFRGRNKRGDFTPDCRTCYDLRHATAEAVLRTIGPRARTPTRG